MPSCSSVQLCTASVSSAVLVGQYVAGHHPFAANATEEFLVRRRPLYEVRLMVAYAVQLSLTCQSQVVGQLGMWGTLINGIQASALEHYDMTQASWNGATSKLRTVCSIGTPLRCLS